MGLAYQALGQYQQAIDYHQQQLAIAREIGVREAFPQESRGGEANSLFNSGLVLAKLGQRQPAQENYQAAKALYKSMGQQHYVQTCDTALSELAQLAAKPRPQWVPIALWFLVGLGIAALLWWLLR